MLSRNVCIVSVSEVTIQTPHQNPIGTVMNVSAPQPDPALKKFLACMSVTAEEFVDVHSDSENRNLVAEGERPCPICGDKMKTQTEFDVIVDVCPQHGVWLDKNELGRILESYKGSAVQTARLRSEYERGKRTGRRNPDGF